MSSHWFWWQVFGITGRSLEPRDHGRTSLFLFLWSVGVFNNFMLPFLIEQSCSACVARPCLGFSEYYITQPDLSACKDVSYIIYHKTRGNVYITPPPPGSFGMKGTIENLWPAGCLTVKSSRSNFFNKLLKRENNSVQSRNASAFKYKI